MPLALCGPAPLGYDPVVMASPLGARFLLFRVAAEHFLIDIMAVRQILPFEGVTHVPRGPSFLEGLVSFHGKPIPLVDLRVRLLPDTPAGDASRQVVLVVATDVGDVGLKVDEVRRIVEVDLDSIVPPPPLVRGMAGRLFFGVVQTDDSLHLLIDLNSVFSSSEKETMKAEV